MELRQLTYFEAVVRLGGVTRAAEALHVAQPAVSAQVAKLERELGTPLLHRTTRRVRPTHAGEVVARHARRVLADVTALRSDVDELTGGMRGRVRIGAIQALGPFDLAGALAGFRREHPGVTLSLRGGRRADLVAALVAGELDLAIAPLSAAPGGSRGAATSDRYGAGAPDRHGAGAPSGRDGPVGPDARIEVVTLFDDELVLVTPTDHPLAGRDALDVADLRATPFVCLAADSGLRRRLDRLARDAGVDLDVCFEASAPAQIRELVAHGLGAALLARSVAEAAGPPVGVHRLAPEPLPRPVGLLRFRDHPPSAAVRACHAHLLAARPSG